MSQIKYVICKGNRFVACLGLPFIYTCSIRRAALFDTRKKAEEAGVCSGEHIAPVEINTTISLL